MGMGRMGAVTEGRVSKNGPSLSDGITTHTTIIRGMIVIIVVIVSPQRCT